MIIEEEDTTIKEVTTEIITSITMEVETTTITITTTTITKITVRGRDQEADQETKRMRGIKESITEIKTINDDNKNLQYS